ncbi:MAG TPA: hypothetical protein VGK67_26565 [Myxococcales bacterium]|jgi:hypothetical protein
MRTALCILSAALALVLSLSLPTAARAEPASDSHSGTAQLPLSELLDLRRELDLARSARPESAPVAAVVEKVELSGLLLDDAAELTAHVEAKVFSSGWQVLPLLRKDPRLHVLGFPRLDSGTLSMTNSSLSLVTSQAGPYAFDVGLRVQGKAEGKKRVVRLALGASTVASLKLKYDPALFKLEAPNAVLQSDGALLFPEEGAFNFSWEPVAETLAARAKVEAPKRPAIEPVVERARVSVVSTLAGRRIVRVLFELKLEGPKPIAVKIPDGYALERVYLNGAPRAQAIEGGRVSLEASPERSGDPRGRLELLLSEEPGRFMLSGALRFTLPSASWRTDEYVVELHLPEVFNYRWRGGSVSPCEAPPEPAPFASALPTPGKPMCLRQALVFEPPTAEVAYDVDLTGKYWTGVQASSSPTP